MTSMSTSVFDVEADAVTAARDRVVVGGSDGRSCAA